VLAFGKQTLSDFRRDFTIVPGAICALQVANRKSGRTRSDVLSTAARRVGLRFEANIEPCVPPNVGLEAVAPIQAVSLEAVPFQAVSLQAVSLQAVAFQAVAAIKAVSASHVVLLRVI
jgi:hypothetical protein